MNLKSILSLFSGRYPFVNGVFIPSYTPFPKRNVISMDDFFIPVRKPKIDEIKRREMVASRRSKRKKKRGY